MAKDMTEVYTADVIMFTKAYSSEWVCINGVNAGRIAKVGTSTEGFCWTDTGTLVDFTSSLFVWKR